MPKNCMTTAVLVISVVLAACGGSSGEPSFPIASVAAEKPGPVADIPALPVDPAPAPTPGTAVNQPISGHFPVAIDLVKVTELSEEQLNAIRHYRWAKPNYVARSQTEWEQAWATRINNLYGCDVNLLVLSNCPEPAIVKGIDFTKYTLIGITDELSPGQNLSLLQIVNEGDVLKVQMHRGGTYCACSFAQVQSPFTRFFLIPSTTLPIQFEETKDKSVDFNAIRLGEQFREDQKATSTFVLTSENAWNATWDAFQMPGSIRPIAPSIDFSTQMVVGVSLPKNSSSCQVTYINQVIENPRTIQVLYGVSQPTDQQQCLANKSRQTVFINTARSAKPISFVDTSFL